MEYTVSEKIQNAFDTIMSLPETEKALLFLEEDHAFSMAEHKEFIACESPTFEEKERAALYAEKLSEYGVSDVKTDAHGNVYGVRKGTGNGPVILCEAHMDTVFPKGSVKEIIDRDGVIYAPGATDDTRGLTAILAVLRAMKECGIQTEGDIIFAGMTREEGMGSLGGMHDFLADGHPVDASVSVDGADTESITCEATGFRTYEVTFHGIGGHAYVDFGDMANPLHAAARAVAKIADFTVPAEPKTTFCVSNFHAGNKAGAHAIVPEASIMFNIRSNDQAELDRLTKRSFDAVEEACREETEKWGKDTITWDSVQYVEVPAGVEDHHLPIVEAAVCAARYFTREDRKEYVHIPKGGCVNGNMAIGKGIPAVTIGGGPKNGKVHSLEEYFPYEEAYRLPKDILLLLLMAAGVPGEAAPVVEKIPKA